MTEFINDWITVTAIAEILGVIIMAIVFIYFFFKEIITDFIWNRKTAKKHKQEYDEIMKNVSPDIKSIFDEE